MGRRVLILTGSRKRALVRLEDEGVDLRECLVADRLTLLPAAGSKFRGVLIEQGASEDLRAEAAARFPGLAAVTMRDLVGEDETDGVD